MARKLPTRKWPDKILDHFQRSIKEKRIKTEIEMLRGRSVAQENMKRNKKRKLQLEILDKQRVDQWENSHINMLINALPKSTPKMMQDTVEKIRQKDPAGAMTAEATLNMIDLFKENVTGMHVKDLWSDPF